MKKLTLILIFAVLFSVVAPAEWISFSRSSEKAVSRNLVADRGQEITLDINVPGVWLEDVDVNGETYKQIRIDGSGLTLVKGEPELLNISAFLAMPFAGQANVEIIDAQYNDLKDIKIVPSKGNLTRDINPADVPYEFSNTYSVDGWYPAIETLANAEPFIMRDIAGVRVQITPFQYNAVQETLRVYTKFTVKVSVPATRNSDPRVSANISADYEKLYQETFMNYRSPFATRNGIVAPQDRDNLLIVAYDDFYNAVKPLADWKKRQGYDVTFVKYGDIASNANELKAYIQNKYNRGEISFITFVGDIEHIPTLRGKYENAHSDNEYVKLAGNDNVPDAFISRLSVKNAAQAAAVAAKTVRYESQPEAGAAWYKSALAIASNEGTPADYEYARKLNIALADKLGFNRFFEAYAPKSSGGGWWWKSAMPEFTFPDYSANAANKDIVANAVNTGVAVINYIGHGSDYSWVTTGFNNSDVAKINNGMKMPVIWSVACVNGTIQQNECFAEAWQRAGDANGGGSIGIAAATTNMAWIPPIHWQDEINIVQFAGRKIEKAQVLNVLGMLKTLEKYGIHDKSEGNQIVEQVIYFGEGSTPIRTRTPRAISAEAVVVDNQIVVSIDGERTDNLTVTAYDENIENAVSGVSDRNGYITLPYEGQTHITIYGTDIVPVVDLAIN
ncbi:MAG: C25 family cysteine peptidase [Candidatus Muiribacteriota bacterium]